MFEVYKSVVWVLHGPCLLYSMKNQIDFIELQVEWVPRMAGKTLIHVNSHVDRFGGTQRCCYANESQFARGWWPVQDLVPNSTPPVASGFQKDLQFIIYSIYIRCCQQKNILPSCTTLDIYNYQGKKNTRASCVRSFPSLSPRSSLQFHILVAQLIKAL